MKKTIFCGILFLNVSSFAIARPSGLTLHREVLFDNYGVELPELTPVFRIDNQLANQIRSGTQYTTSLDPLQTVEVTVDRIINIGRKIWSVVEAGRPIVDQTYNSASALPQGEQHWTNLESWRAPRAGIYHISYTNLYGIKVVDFTYRLSFVYGGSYNGVGKYMTGIRVQPSNLNVAWGYNFKVVAEVPEVYNMGTRANPVAAANVIVRWEVKTALVQNNQSDQFLINGLGLVQGLPN